MTSKVPMKDHIMFGMISAHHLVLSNEVREYEIPNYEEFNMDNVSIEDIIRIQAFSGASVGSATMHDQLKRIHQQDQMVEFMLHVGEVVMYLMIKNSDESVQEYASRIAAMADHAVEDHDMLDVMDLNTMLSMSFAKYIAKSTPVLDSLELVRDVSYEAYKGINKILAALEFTIERSDIVAYCKVYEGLVLHPMSDDCAGIRKRLNIKDNEDNAMIPDDAPPFIKFLVAVLDERFKGTPVVKRPEDVH